MKRVYGVGVNDADYVQQVKETVASVNGKQKQRTLWICPFYRTWKGMLERCYSAKKQIKSPTYVGCSVATEWHRFSVFKAWMEKQDWEGNQLDKDLLIPGNTIYSQTACLFVDKLVNTFLLDCAGANTGLPCGVYLQKRSGKFVGQCSNPFTGRREYLGTFGTAQAAHCAWCSRKVELKAILAGQQTDTRVATALLEYPINH